MKLQHTWTPGVLLLVALAWGCTAEGPDNGAGSNICGDEGQLEVVDGHDYCVYQGGIIETRFECPPGLEVQHNLPSLAAVVCGEGAELPEGFETELIGRGFVPPDKIDEPLNNPVIEPLNNPVPGQVKVLLVVDQSASLQCTDPSNQRFDQLGSFVNGLLADGHPIAAVGFSSWTRGIPFTTDLVDLAPVLSSGADVGPATDLQGALTEATALIENDVADDPDGAARTRYVVVVITDGTPEPRCNAGCEDTISACSDGVDNDGDGLFDGDDSNCDNIDDSVLHPDNLYGVCNAPAADFEGLDDELYADFEPGCGAYNQPSALEAKVRAMTRVAAGRVEVHTRLLSVTTEEYEAVCGAGTAAAFGFSGEEAQSLLVGLAETGGGTAATVGASGFELDAIDVSALP